MKQIHQYVLFASILIYYVSFNTLKGGLPATDDEISENGRSPPIGKTYLNFTSAYSIKTLRPDVSYPLVFSPIVGAQFALTKYCYDSNDEPISKDAPASSVLALQCFIKENRDWLKDLYLIHGAFLFRGFNISSALQFQTISNELFYPDEAFNGVYLGTSPRVKGNKDATKVYTASEIPPEQVIPVHLEMSFKKNPPTKIAFWCEHPNTSPGGQTPLSDFRQLWRDMKPQVASRFKKNGLKYIRHYYSENQKDNFYPWIYHPSFTKSWEAMFNTTDTSEAETIAKEQGFQVDWLYGKAKVMRLSHTMNATRIHQETNDEQWNNHLAVLHGDSWTEEYKVNLHRTSSIFLKISLIYSYIKFSIFGQAVMLALGGGREVLGTHVTYSNGEDIPTEDMNHFRAIMARNSVVERWQKGDLMFLDNNRIAHGRQSFSGKRSILTTWVN